MIRHAATASITIIATIFALSSAFKFGGKEEDVEYDLVPKDVDAQGDRVVYSNGKIVRFIWRDGKASILQKGEDGKVRDFIGDMTREKAEETVKQLKQEGFVENVKSQNEL
jgi:hypothetical protein